jgi:hypothetical protein
VVEQAYGVLVLHRRSVRDDEHRPAIAKLRVFWAMSDVAARPPTKTSIPAAEAVTGPLRPSAVKWDINPSNAFSIKIEGRRVEAGGVKVKVILLLLSTTGG